MESRYRVSIHGTDLDLVQNKGVIKVKNREFRPEVIFNGKFYTVFVGGKKFKVEYKDNAVFLDGKEIDFDFQAAPQIMARKNQQFKKGADIKAVIPGKIVEIKVKVGQEVKDQQCLLVLESMKMRNEILSPIEGIVEKITVNDGDQVTSRQLLLKIKTNNAKN